VTPRERLQKIRDLAALLRVGVRTVRGCERWTMGDVARAELAADDWRYLCS